MKVEQATVGGKRQKGRANGAMAETTACNGCKYAKAIFRQAVDDDLILYNPFDKLRSSAPDPEKDWHDVSIEDLDKLTAACESDGWKCLIALCRLAGLRRSEALALRWGDIDWERRMLLGVGGKTRTTVKRKSYKRDVPVEPKLYDVLLDCFGRAVPGEELVCAVNGDNLRRDFAVIRKRAGLPFWKKPFHTLRKNRETEWASDYPIHAVAEWLGHDVEVLAKHYAKVTTDLCERVTGKRQQGEAQQQPAAHATAVTTEAPQVPQGKAS
jgi:integrase